MSPSSCVRCSKPVAILSPSGLCPQCAATDATRDSTVPALPPRAADAPDATRTAPPPGSTASDRPAADPAPVPYAPAGYELLDHLGSGGMGAVYLAREQAAQRVVAMKFLRHPADPDAAARFLVELQVLAALDHPNIVRVLASDFLRAEPFFTMEHVPGGSLSRALDPKKPLPVAEAVRLVRLVAAAVAAAHAQGVIHRDLKPSNILLAADGTPKVADFGLAKRLKRDDQLSASGALGTAGYMPPEQVSRKNGEIGSWSDVYGLGATLYHLLVGRPPFVGETPEATILQVLADPPARLRALRPEIPKELEGIVLKCLEKDPRDRYQTAAELAADLDRFAAGQKPVAPPLTRWRRVKQWARRNRSRLAAAAGAVLAAVGLVWLGMAAAPVPPPAPGPGPVQKTDPVEEMRAQLRAGKPVTLLGANGHPKYHRFLLEPNALADAVDQPCSFNALRHCLLELSPDLGIDDYQVSLELQHRDVQAVPVVPGQLPQDYLGFYFGYSSGQAPDGTGLHLMFAAVYKDYDLKAVLQKLPGKSFVRMWKFGIDQRPGGVPSPNPSEVKALPFVTPPVRPGPWRRVVADISPMRVRIRWGEGEKLETLIDWTGDQTRAEYLDHKQELAKAVPGADLVLPEWTPRLPFGVVSSKAAVSVRKVVVTPTPNPVRPEQRA